MTNKILSDLIDPEVLWKVKKTLSPSITAFSNYFLNSADMSVLKLKFINLCKNSDLENEQIRPMAWKIFFKVLPSEENSTIKTWILKTISDRQRFENIKIKKNLNSINYKLNQQTNNSNDKNKEINNIINNSNKSNNNLDSNLSGYDLKYVIEQDINRTFQNLKLFQDNCVKELLSEILFYWSIQPENTKMSYRQGMNDLLSILFFAFFPFYFSEKRKSFKNNNNNNKNTRNDSNNNNNNNNINNNSENKNQNQNQSDLYSKEEQQFLLSLCKEPKKNSKALYLFFHDEKYISHDLFTVFTSMMDFGIKHLYETQKDLNNNSINSQDDFIDFKAEEKQIDMVYKRALDIYHNKLRNYDQNLFTYLIKHKIDPNTYMIRWLRCLFCREFSYKVSIQLWDIIFLEEFFQSDKKLQFVDYLCVAMYENIKDEIMVGQEEEILKLLFRYPQIESPKNLIKNAYKIRSYFELNQYQNHGNKEDFNKEVKINLNKANENCVNRNNYNNNNPNKIRMTKKEKEIYDFNNKEINYIKKEELNNKAKIAMNISKTTNFKMNYLQIPGDKEGEMLQNMALLSKLKNLEKKYGKHLQKEDDEDLKFIINELYTKFKFKLK